MEALRTFVFLFFLINYSLAQPKNHSFFQPSDSIDKKRLLIVESTIFTGYSASMIGLNQMWYKGYQKTNFHFFNDNREWLQMDKMGHLMSSYYVSKYSINIFEWTGLDKTKAILYGGIIGFGAISSIELLDGYSEAWGASKGDLLANFAGTILEVGQQAIWQESKINVKFSAHLSDYAKYRSNVLGVSNAERVLKDYNGQTYWFTVSPSVFLKSKIPNWMGIAIGYGADGMIGGEANPTSDQDGNLYPIFTRQRQLYLSLDLDLSKLETKYPFINSIFKAANFIKIPFPALEFNQYSGVKFRYFYF